MPECDVPEDHLIQVAIHGKWLKLMTIVMAIVNGLGLPGLAWMINDRAQLLAPVCLDHIIESEMYVIRRANPDCERAVMEVRYRLQRYLNRVDEFNNNVR